MRKKLFLTTAIVAVSFVANNALAENITQRQVIESGDVETYTNVTASNINSTGFGGGVIYNKGNVTINGNSIFMDNRADSGGVIYNGTSGFMNISNSTFNNNQTDDIMEYGGAIYNVGEMVISASTFNDNTAANSGGAIYNSGNITIRGNSSFAGNKYDGSHLNDIFNVGVINLVTKENEIISFASGLDGDGGNDHGTINISGDGKVHVENELIYHDVNLNSGILELVSGTSAQKTSIVVDNGATLNTTGVTFSNQEKEDGAAIENNGTAIISNTTFKNNTADSSYSFGGAIYNDEHGKLIVSDSAFLENEAKDSEEYGCGHGGAISNDGGEITISNTTFTENNTYGSNSWISQGGAIYNEKGKINISNSLFELNTSTGSSVSAGGAIFIDSFLDEERNPAAIVEISNSGFNYNETSLGGAIFNGGQLDLSNVSFVENEAFFTDRNFGGNGGAIYNYWSANINGGLFKYNRAFDGGAIFNRDTATISSTFTENTAYCGGAIYNERNMTISDSTFISNTAMEDNESDSQSGQGGAIYNYGKLNITNTTFENNNVDAYFSYGGAIYNDKYGEITISDSVFLENEAENGDGYGSGHGGAISNVGGKTMTISNTTFNKNKTYGANGSPDAGGAIYNDVGSIKITNTTFTNNETIGSASGAGGAVYNEGSLSNSGIMDISDSSFTGNRASFGGAIYNDDILTLTDVQFNQNQAHMDYASEDYGGIGGAIYNNYFGQATIINGSFINNSSDGDGGAIYNKGKISLSGNNIFKGNRDGNGLNDINNDGTINIIGNISLDGGISGYRGMSNYGKIVFADGANIMVEAGTTTISQNNVENKGATLHFNIHNGFSGDYAFITNYSTLDNEFILADNNLYNIVYTDTKGTYTINKKSASEIAKAIGISTNEAATISAITSGEGTSASFNNIANSINDLIQSGKSKDVKLAIEAAKLLAPDNAPIVKQTQAETTAQVFNAVGTRFSSGNSKGLQGISSGDVLHGASIWMQGLANHAKLNKTSKSDSFKSDTYGVSLGIEKKIDNNIKSGIGYAYSTTDVDTKGRDTDVKTHTIFAYGEYKPSSWFVNGIISYGWSDYKENKNVIGTNIKSKYDIKTFGMQAMTGYDLYTKFATITPEVGLRYIHISSEHYTDSIGQNIAASDNNIVTGIIGSKVSKTFETTNGLTLSPEARLAMTYDLNKPHNKSTVTLPNASSYIVNGGSLERFGVEVGVGLTTEVYDNIEMSLGYEGHFRANYQNHSGLFDIKYKF